MKNVSLVISVISLIAAITFGALFLSNNSKKASIIITPNLEITKLA